MEVETTVHCTSGCLFVRPARSVKQINLKPKVRAGFAVFLRVFSFWLLYSYQKKENRNAKDRAKRTKKKVTLLRLKRTRTCSKFV